MHDTTEADNDPQPGLDVADHAAGKTRLLSRQCQTCIFRPGNPMRLSEGRLAELIAETRAAQSYIVCHSTLPDYLYPDVMPAICRGFADRYTTQALQLMQRLWGFIEIDPPGETATPPSAELGDAAGAAPTAVPL